MVAAKGYTINVTSTPLASARTDARNKPAHSHLSQAVCKLWGTTGWYCQCTLAGQENQGQLHHTKTRELNTWCC